jgi:hypothetical protein
MVFCRKMEASFAPRVEREGTEEMEIKWGK